MRKKLLILFWIILIFSLVIFTIIFSYNWKEIEQEYEYLLIKDPKNLEILFKLLVIYSAQGKLDKAFEIYKKINLIDPKFLSKKADEIVEKNNDPFSLYQIAFASYFSNNKDKALIYFQRLYEKYPRDDWIISFLAYLYYEKENIKETERLVEEGLKINNDNEMLHALKCVLYYKKGNYILALREYFITLNILQRKGYKEIWELLRSLVY
ncbi:MAG: tetratricopeptide repeat protein [Dictyoglomaceae bacterium]|nr:tetratricopeptide repeat protein [Dictyoglomaceae bacterium]